ncbi:ATP-dependent DNA ligase [Rahnella phage Sarma103]|nr:ATP-dependent DNA ligase [Rahnella phage Sarma103]
MIITNPYKAVDFKESAVLAAAERCGSLIADVKYDGVRLNLCVTTGLAPTAKSIWLSRVSKTIPALEHLGGMSDRWFKFLNDDRQMYPNGLMIDGEAMVKGVDFNTSSGLLRTKWTKKTNFDFHTDPWAPLKAPFHLDPSKLKVVVYGVLPLDVVTSGSDYDVMNCLMREHAKITVGLLKEHFPEIEWVEAESYDVFDMESLNELYELKRSEGHEGLVVKDPWGIYRRGKKTGWWKMKPECEADGVIVGLNWGTEGLANEGKVIGFEVLLESGRVVSANNISQALMEEFTGNVLTHEGARTAAEYIMKRGDAGYYEGWQCQVLYMEETPDGSLRHPSFDKFRGTESDPTVKM